MSQPLKRTLVLDVVPHGTDRQRAEEDLQELLSLATTAGGIVVQKIIQKRGRPSSKTFLGEGKIAEAASYTRENEIQLVIINGLLRPNQVVHLGKLFPHGIKIWDRVDLILRIFESHASSPEAKMQIKLAQLHHEIPKIYSREATTLFERAGAGIGTRGAGEKGIEDEKRHIRAQIKTLERKLEILHKRQGSQRSSRKKTGMPSVALVGYTNAGKSSLMRLLTKKDNIAVADALFVTLETRIGRVYLPDIRTDILLADTIGFIRDLPADLISSFLTTLEEVREADLLLHVIDLADDRRREKIAVVQDILRQIGCEKIPQIYVFNKTDLAAEQRAIRQKRACLYIRSDLQAFSPVFVSTATGEGIDGLKAEIARRLSLMRSFGKALH